jgi:hypothetical protein
MERMKHFFATAMANNTVRRLLSGFTAIAGFLLVIILACEFKWVAITLFVLVVLAVILLFSYVIGVFIEDVMDV